jgi:hypothetical protein
MSNATQSDALKGGKAGTRGEGFPQILHDRARDVGQDLFKLLLSLSTGILAVYFFALTAEVKPALSLSQKVAALVGLSFLSLAVFSGLVSLHADSRRNYFWASALQAPDKERRASLYKQRDRWMAVEFRTYLLLVIGFLGGVISSVAYMILRIVSS